MDPGAFEELKAKLIKFMKDEIYPNEIRFIRECQAIGHASNEWTHPPIMIELKRKARAQGLWNLFLPVDSAALAGGRAEQIAGGLTNLQYAELCEIMGTASHAEFAAEAMNCASPDTGNMETLARFGTVEQKERWLVPLLEGNIRSSFAMTEPDVASSDARNISIRIDKDGKDYVINGRKWWITGAGSLHTEILILMGKVNPVSKSPHRQQSMILVPMNTPGITLVRPMLVFGDDDAPKGHMEIRFENVRVPQSNVLLGEGRGFEIAQARLGPGRIHHCMRSVGQAERALSLMCRRAQSRTAFGKKLSQMDGVLTEVARSRADINACRLLIQDAARLMDELGNRDPRTVRALSLIKAFVPKTVATVIDRAMQVHGGMGVSQDTPLWFMYIGQRSLRFADGPDEVHWRKAGRMEFKLQGHSPLAKIPLFPTTVDKVFRRSTDPLSQDAKNRLIAARL